MMGKFTFLGTGASTGVPMIGCRCSVCTAGVERLRPSALVEVGEKRFVIDVGPDFRQQALKYGIDRFDGALITHGHFDHIGGLEELRVFHFNEGIKRMPLLLNQETYDMLKERLGYVIEAQEDGSVLSARFAFHVVPKSVGSVTFEGVHIGYFSYQQLGISVLGFRLGDLAYVSDIKEYDESVIEAIAGVKTLVVDAFKGEPSRGHFSLTQAVGFAQKCGVERAYFTHLAHEVDAQKVRGTLPGNMVLAYDGLELEFDQ